MPNVVINTQNFCFQVVLKVSVLINLIFVLYMALYTAPESQKELRHLDPAPIGRNIQFFGKLLILLQVLFNK